MASHNTTQESDVLREPKPSAARHNSDGEEILDPTPMQPPLGYKKTLSLHEQILQQVRIAKMQLIDDVDLEETDEEADDFEVGDDYEPLSPYENDHIPSIKVMKAHVKAVNKKIREAQNAKAVADFQKDNPGGPPPAPAPKADTPPTAEKAD